MAQDTSDTPANSSSSPRRQKPAAGRKAREKTGATADPPKQDAARRKGKKKSKPASKPEAQATQQSAKGLGAVVMRNEYYRDGFRTLQRVALIQVIIILGLIGAMIFQIHVNQPENRYFATSEDGRLIPMQAMSEPNLSTPALMSWVAQAATEVMTFGFHDYQRRLQEASRNFTRRGWESFTEALDKARIIEAVKQNQYVVTAAPRNAPIVVSEGIQQGRYTWVVELPLKVTYQAGSKTRSDNLLVKLRVVRVPKLESPNGIGINQWNAYQG